jgi:AcrR family transcriptional regulator
MSTPDDRKLYHPVTMSPAPHRTYDAAASRRALLDAAAHLFQERGYDRATVRDIGERAGVDPALIARYFDGKEGLYLAALADERTGPPRAHIESGDLVEAARLMFDHWDERGMSPAMRTLFGPAPTEEVRDQVRAILGGAILDPLTQELTERGVPQPRERAELLLAAMAGIELARRNGVLPAIDGLATGELLDLIEPLAAALQDD